MKLPSFLRLFGERWLVNRNRERSDSTKSGHGQGRRAARLDRLLRPNLEGLEDRTLLSVLPAPTILDRLRLGTGGHDSAPQIAVNPLNSQKLVMVWTTNGDPTTAGDRNTATIGIQGRYSANGGNTWTPLPGGLGGVTNPATGNAYPNTMEPSVAFDRFDNFYIVRAQRTVDQSSGAIVLDKFFFRGNDPCINSGACPDTFGSKVLYQWAHNAPADNLSDPAYNPVVVVDTNHPGFRDPQTDRQQESPFSSIGLPGNPGIQNSEVYVAWNTRNQAPTRNAQFDPCIPAPFNPNVIKIVASSDGGANFTTQKHINAGLNCGPDRYTLPQMTVSQGQSLTHPAPRVPGGQLNVSYVASNNNLRFNSVRDGGVGYFFTTGAIRQQIPDACAPDPGPPPQTVHRPSFVDIEMPNVNIPDAAFRSNDVQITVAIDHLTMEDVRIEVFRGLPQGTVTCQGAVQTRPALLENRLNADPAVQNPANTGIQQTHLGILRDRPNAMALFPANWNGVVGTTFDDEAPRLINDPTAGNNSRHASHFRPESTLLSNTFPVGLTADQINNTPIVLRVYDMRNSGQQQPPQAVFSWSIRFTGGLSPRAETIIPGTTNILGVTQPQTGPWQTGIAYSPDYGTSPIASIASDNTLGSFSPYQGRLYVAYAGGSAASPDIFLLTSDDAGASWSGPRRVNANPSLAQFNPNIGVDNSTGTFVLSWYDASNDAGRVRVARYITTSIDGGLTYSEQVYANRAQAPIDAITRQATVLGPVPENMGVQNPTRPQLNFDSRNIVYNYGDIQGMAVSDGRVILAWTGNENVVGRSDILVARVNFPVGPRIVTSTMGPLRRSANNAADQREYCVKPIFDTTNATCGGTPGGSLIFFNQTFSPTGVRQLDGFTVTFDRFVDANPDDDPLNPYPFGFRPEDVKIFFRSPTTPLGQPGELIQATEVIPVFDERLAQDDPSFGMLPPNQRQRTWCQTDHNLACGAKKFLVRFAPQSRTGTYSYSVGPAVTDRIRGSFFVVSGGNLVSYPTDRTQFRTQFPLRVPSVGTGGSGSADDFTISTLQINNAPAGEVINQVRVRLEVLEHTYVSDLVITLISPSGKRVLLSNQRGGGGQDYRGIIFDSSANTSIAQWQPPLTGSFRPEESLNAFQTDDANGLWQLEIQDIQVGDIGQLPSLAIPDVPWFLEIQTGLRQGTARHGNWMDQDSDGRRIELLDDLLLPANQSNAYATPRPLNGVPFTAPYDLTTLPLSIPGPFVLSSNVPGLAPSQDNLVTDRSVNAFDITFDRNMDPTSVTPQQILRMQGGQGVISGLSVTQIDARTFRLNFPTQTLAGTYSFLLGSGIRAVNGDQMDNNANAGLDTLRGFDPLGTTITQTYRSLGAPVSLDLKKTVSMPLTIPSLPEDTFLLQGLTVRLNISFPANQLRSPSCVPQGGDPADDACLIANLVHPDGTRVLLFDRLRQGQSAQDAFPNTVLDDTIDIPRTTSITLATAPLLGTYNPQLPLSVLKNKLSVGTWRLEITNRSGVAVGRINEYELRLQKPVPGTGLGEPAADLSTASFRLWVWDGRNPVSRTQWQPLGPASTTEEAPSGPITRSARIGGIAVDPSDPSGNTVFVAGASGGLWKASNFLTKDPLGPTYIPLTDFGPALGINVGSVTVFGRNSDPRQSVVFLATGEGDTANRAAGSQGPVTCGVGPGQTCRGVGLIRSMDGGQSWLLLDSTVNVDSAGQPLPINGPAPDGRVRDKRFVGNSSFKVMVDPRLSPAGKVVAYVAMTGTNGGIYRTEDTGDTWQLLRAGQPTDIVFDENSFVTDALGRPGNLQVLYAAFRGDGIYITPDRGTVWNRLDGGGGNPLIVSAALGTAAPVSAPAAPLPASAAAETPNGANGRILLGKPSLTGNPLQDKLYEGWLYAAVVQGNGRVAGLYLTKDTGFNWTRIRLANAQDPGDGYSFTLAPTRDGAPSNGHLVDYSNLEPSNQGNYDVSLAVDPNNPNVIYFGGIGMVRVDTTGISDAHSFFLPNDRNEGTQQAPEGRLRCLPYLNGPPPPNVVSEAITAQPTVIDQCSGIPSPAVPYYPEATPTLNMIQDPNNPFVANAVFRVGNLARWNNTGVGTRWIDWNLPMTVDRFSTEEAVDHHRIVAFRDQSTGRTRLIFGADQGVYTAVDDGKGGYMRSIGDNTGVTDDCLNPSSGRPVIYTCGNVRIPFGARNGNLEIAQIYAGAVQPSIAAAQLNSRIRGMFYNVQQDAGFPASQPGILDPNDRSGPGGFSYYGHLRWQPPAGGDGTDVATDQQGFGTVYHTLWPCCGGNGNNFFQVDNVGRTTGLVSAQFPNDWPIAPSSRFALNPLDSRQIVISSVNSGRIFATYDQGARWLVIGNPANLDSTYAQALAWGAPRPEDPFGARNNFIYAGTVGGRIFVTFTGGGGSGNDWLPLSNGLDGSPVMAISTNPNRGSHEAYAVTLRGVYHMVDSRAGGAWVPITGNLGQLTHQVFQNPSQVDTIARYLASLAADWRYVLPDDPNAAPSVDPGATHPILYVGGEGGVFRSLDDGRTWTLFPNVALDGASRDGGWLPVVQGMDLDVALGRINQMDGFPEMARSNTDMLYVSTYGRSSFGIRLAPLVFPETVRLSPTQPNDGPGNVGSDRGISNTDRITNVIRPVIEGITEASQARVGGNRVHVFLFDVTDPNNRRLIGRGDANEFGRFAIQVDAGVYRADGTTDGVKRLEIYAEDEAGAVNGDGVRGNTTTFTFELRSGQPPLPSVPDLAAFADSGFSNTDNITNSRTPTFLGTGVPGMAVRIFANGQLVGQGLVDAQGNYSIQTSTLADDTYTITARQFDLAGNISGFTAPLQPVMIVDTIVPAAPPFDLDRASDSGISQTDHITNVNRPVFTGTGEPLAQLSLIIDGLVAGTTTVSPVGTFTVQPNGPIADGSHTVVLQLLDRAGNLGVPSAPLQAPLFIDTQAPRVPSVPQLAQASRSGQGNTTRFNTPVFVGTGEPNIFMQIFANGNFVGQGRVDSAGNYAVTTSPLADGSYTITGRLVDIAGNLSPVTGALQPPLIVDTGVGRPTLRLSPSLVLGGTGPNDVITPFSPQVLEGTAEVGTTVTIKDPNAGTVFDTFLHSGPGTNYTRSLNLAEGRYVMVAEVRDQAGNVSTSEVLTMTVNRNALDADRRFIRALYVSALTRTGSLNEWDQWVPLLRQPNGRFVVANAIERSQEARTIVVKTWYEQFLGRTAKNDEEQGLVRFLLQGFTEEQVLATVLGSDEYFNRSALAAGFAGSPNSSTFIQALYLQILKRAPAQEEVNAWLAALPNLTRGGVARIFVGSAEFRTTNVLNFYRDLLLRPTPPTQPEVTAWVVSGLDLTTIRVLFKAAPEYYFRQTGFLP